MKMTQKEVLKRSNEKNRKGTKLEEEQKTDLSWRTDKQHDCAVAAQAPPGVRQEKRGQISLSAACFLLDSTFIPH